MPPRIPHRSISRCVSCRSAWTPPHLRSSSNPKHSLRSHNASPTRPFTTTPATAHQPSSSSSSSSSVDPNEVSHFNALASTWWDAHGSSRLLHLMNPLRHRFIASCLAQSDPSTTTPRPGSAADGERKYAYLDIGCGGGIFAESAARLPSTRSVLAIDPSPEVLSVAKAHMRGDPGLVEGGVLEYRNIAIEDLTASSSASTSTSRSEPGSHAETAQYDIVTLFEVLEHVATPSAFLTNATAHVKPGGWFVCSTIARTWASWFTTKLIAEEVVGIVPRGTHEWSKYVNEHELRQWFVEQGGWEMPRAMGAVYVPGIGWREVSGSEKVGNYFFGIRKAP